jgi:hypothetical protein
MEKVSERLRRMPDWYIGQDPDDSSKIAVWEVPANGRGPHRLVEQGFRDRHEAIGWIRYHSTGRQSPAGGKGGGDGVA